MLLDGRLLPMDDKWYQGQADILDAAARRKPAIDLESSPGEDGPEDGTRVPVCICGAEQESWAFLWQHMKLGGGHGPRF